MSVVKCHKHNVIFNPHNEACSACSDDETKEFAYAPSLLQELRNRADFVAVKQSELQQLKLELTAAQAEIARLKEEIEELKVHKEQNLARLGIENTVTKLQSALDVAVEENNALRKNNKELADQRFELMEIVSVAIECLEFFATEGFYRMTDFITTSPVAEVGKMPENIKVYGNPVLTLGLKKATEALDKIKQIRE